MFTLKQTSVTIALLCLIGNISFAQTSVQSFGTGTGSFITANSTSTSFLPNPTGSGTTFVAINNGGGAINLVNPGLIALGSGTEVRASASSNANVNKFTPVLSYTNSTSYYTTFWMVLGNSTGGNTATNGEWAFYQGAGAGYSSNGDMPTGQVHTGLRFTFGNSGAITFNYLNNTTWTALASVNISQGNLYKVEIMGNNGASTINYNYGNGANSVAANRYDLWIDGVLVGNDLVKGGIGNSTNVNSITYIGKNSTANAANIFVDDITVYNSIPSNISASCAEPTTGSSSFTANSGGASSINLSWTNGDGSNRLIIARRDNPVSAIPANNSSYTGNTAFGSGTQISTGEYVVYNGSGSSATITSLQAGYTYHFRIVEFNCSNSNEKYYNSGAVTANASTTPASVTSFQNVCNSDGSIVINWDVPSSGYDGILVFARTVAPSYNPTGNNGASFNANSDFSAATTYGTDKCVYNGTGNTVTINGLTSGSVYYFRAYAYTGSIYSTVSPIITGISGVANVSGLSATGANGIINVSWTNPGYCYDEIMFVAVATSNVTAIPTGDGSLYDADAFFGTDVSNVNMPANEFVVYKSTGTSFTIYGLINGTNYKVKAFARSGNYWSSGIQVNATPANVAGDFRSIQNGDWTNINTWQRFNGANWVTPNAGQFPNQQTASVTIRNGHTVTVNGPGGNYQMATLIVENGAKLYVNSTSTLRYLNIYTQINNDGIIGNGGTNDGIALNIEGANVFIGGDGVTIVSRIRKDENNNTTSNLTISTDIQLYSIGSAKTLLYNNQGNTYFNVTINSGATVSTPANFGNVSIDGTNGGAGGNRRGSITVAGTLNINGILYMTCQNGSGGASTSNKITIEDGGVINVDSIDADNSSGSGHVTTIKNGGILNIYGRGFYDFSTSNNTYTCETNSLVHYSGTSAQTVESGIDYADLKYSGGANNKTQNGDLTVNGNLTVDAAIYNVGTSSRDLNLGGNFTLENGGTMNATNCREYLTILCNSNTTQVFNGNGQIFNCFLFTSAKSSGSLSFNNSNSSLYVKDDMILDYTGSSLFSDNLNTLTVGGAIRFGSSTSTSSNFNITGTILFNFDTTTSGYSNICNVAQNGITVAQLNNITLQAISVATVPEVQIYPTSGGQTLTIKGNVTIMNTNYNSIFITNNNNIVVRGNWTTYNQSGFTEGTGRVTFNGTSNQTITGAETFYQMEINNPTSVTLNNNIIVTNALRLNQGVIITGVNEVHVTNNNAANAVVLHNVNSYVQGRLRRNVASTGTYDFPIGDNNYQLATVKLNSSSGISNLIASFTSGLPVTMPNPTTCKVNGTGISNMLNSGYWTISPNAITAVNYEVTLNGRGYSNFSGGATQLCVIKRSNSSSPWLGTNSSGVNGYHNAANQGLSGGAAKGVRTGLTSFSDFGIGFGAVPLPVQLTSFDVVANDNNSTTITWSTASELNNDYFEVLHSLNGIDFNLIGTVKGAGTSQFANEYAFLHTNASCGNNYYRLRQVDFDGKYEFSSIKFVNFNCASNFTLYPNPAVNTIFINSTSISDLATINIYNIEGRLIITKSYNQSGINISELPTGLYLIELVNGNSISQTRFIKSE